MTAPYYGLSPFQLPEATSSTREVVLAARDHLVSQRDTLELQIISANALLNSTSPVNRLPTEIVIGVFRSLKEESTEFGTQPWYNVAAVCRSWRAIASSTPLLWNDIHVGPDMNAVLFQAFLERSHPISIAVSFASTTKLAVYLALIRAHLSRVRVLRFISTPRSEADLVADLLNESMPALEELSVWLNPSWNEDEDEEADNMDAYQEGEVFAWRSEQHKLPHLVDLSLRGIVLAFSATLGASLRRLELRDCIGLAASLAVLNNVLRRCANLERLVISRYRCDDEQMGPGPRISLPKTLRTLVLEDSHWYTVDVLDSFYVPPTVRVSITKLVQNEQEDWLDSPISKCIPEDRTCLPILAMVDCVHVELQRANGLCTFVGAVGAHTITIKTIATHSEDTVVPDIARDLQMLFRNAPLVELVINCEVEHYVTMMDWIHMLERFQLIQRLSVIGGPPSQYEDQPCYTLVAALRGPGNVLCPNLRELALVSRNPEEDKLLQNLTACLERREARGQRLAVLRLGLICGTAGCLGADEKAELEQREVRRIEALSHLADKVEFASNAVTLFDNSPYEEMTSAEGGSEM